MAAIHPPAFPDLTPRGLDPDQDIEMEDADVSDLEEELPTHLETDTADECDAGSTKSLSQDNDFSIYENDRRYCNNFYPLPNDETEQTRLNIQHQLHLVLLDGELTVTPPPTNPTRILDVGSWPGDWAIAMAEQHPDAQVFATDVNLFDESIVSVAPSNVTFQIDDAEDEWTFHEPFDLIHARYLAQAVGNWPAFYAQAFRHLKPGGALHLAESDMSADCLHIPNNHPNSYTNIYLNALRSAADAAPFTRGMDHMRTNELAAAGFTDVRVYNLEVPIGPWPTDTRGYTLGKMALIVLLEKLEAVSLRLLTKYGGWDADQVLDMCDKIKMEIVNWRGATGLVRFAVATKPAS